jgi:hypothetical protein
VFRHFQLFAIINAIINAIIQAIILCPFHAVGCN